MTRSLRSFPEDMRKAVARRRAGIETKGNAYWGARDYLIGKGEIPKENRLPIPEKPMASIVSDGITKIKEKIADGKRQVTHKPRTFSPPSHKIGGRNTAVLQRGRTRVS